MLVIAVSLRKPKNCVPPLGTPTMKLALFKLMSFSSTAWSPNPETVERISAKA
jgi:hypothetical protein